ncbi:MAG: DoxX family membrane protein [Desulfosarcina sp.]|nr:DoxX family membrane protein [Desulfosarcina sp.]MBC2744105.1 DoxX family membrane protein [Desulfosarcina sp.]MBC2767014.1 DoxX family membrane protein [Desulfosarcina sp.]
MGPSIAARGEDVRPLPSAVVKNVTIVVRIVLGAVFLFSCTGKIADPAAFAAIVANYQILPPTLVSATAVIFPWIEAVCGLALVFGRFEKGAALLVSLMMVVFIGIILYNGYRGLNIACGCFSLAANAPSNIAVDTLRNLFILAAGAWVFVFPRRRRARSTR